MTEFRSWASTSVLIHEFLLLLSQVCSTKNAIQYRDHFRCLNVIFIFKIFVAVRVENN